MGERTAREAVGWMTDKGARVPPTKPFKVSDACVVGAHQAVMKALSQAPSQFSTQQRNVVAASATLRDSLRRGEMEVPPAHQDATTKDDDPRVTPNVVGRAEWFFEVDDLTNSSGSYFIDHWYGKSPSYINWSTDNCSFSPDKPGGYNFIWPCRRHDMGWRNMQDLEQYRNLNVWTPHNKAVADRRFELDLNQACDNQGGGFRCDNYAADYAETVCRYGWNTCDWNVYHYDGPWPRT